MATKNEVGISENTPMKHKNFISFLNQYLKCLDYSRPFNFIDTNSGPGRYEIDGKICYGSAVIAQQILSELPFYEAHLFEVDKTTAAALQETMSEVQNGAKLIRSNGTSIHAGITLLRPPGLPVPGLFDHRLIEIEENNFTVYNRDNQHAVRYLQPKGVLHEPGLIYFDPNAPRFLSALDLAASAPKMDVLSYVYAAQIKKSEGKAKRGQTVKEELLITLDKYVSTLDKKFNYITKPRGKQQWVHVFSTNRENFIPPSCMYDLTTETGQEIYNYVRATKPKEDKEDKAAYNELMEFLGNPDAWKE